MKRRLIAGFSQDLGKWKKRKVLDSEKSIVEWIGGIDEVKELFLSRDISISELKVEGLVIRERSLVFKIEWVAVPFSRGSSQPRSPTLQADSLPAAPPRKPFCIADTCNENVYIIIMGVGGCEGWKNKSVWVRRLGCEMMLKSLKILKGAGMKRRTVNQS